MKRLLFYGPTGQGLPADKLGGGERGCLRTIELYRRLGIEILIVEKPTLGRGMLIFLKEYLLTPVFYIMALVLNPRTPVHIVGFYEHQLFYEFIIFVIAKCFGRKTTYELRNGTMVKTFYQHHWLYRRMMRFIIEHANAVLCQGMEYVEFIKQHWNANTIYYPNFVMDKVLLPYDERK